MSYPATLLPAGEGRRGDLLPAPSPEIFTAHTIVKRSTGAAGSGSPNSQSARLLARVTATGAADGCEAPTFSLTRAFPCSRATSPACGPGLLSPRSPAGASGRCDFPNRCGGTGCVLLSAAVPAVHRRKDGKGRTPKCPLAALTSSAMTADPRRADPGYFLAGAVAARLRPYHWPVALRGGGHIVGVA